ncbi:protein kinase [Penicillium angulare]|uniref:protein kinase n=1 Tax=Penicillium angulare TaxID=116970 RepID=UPI0025422751|nr:protein kinase [Penicillium angulare]KAJ5272511.1 protein kinase [Penicillium angulare]
MSIDRGGQALCQFFHSRIIDIDYVMDEIMDYYARPPEVICDMGSGNKVDIWVIGMMVWKFATGRNSFLADADENLDLDEQHLAEMISHMGPSPLSFLKSTYKWEQENWFD